MSKSELGDTTDDVQYIPLTLLASIAYDWEVLGLTVGIAAYV